MTFDSKNFNKEKIQQLSNLINHIKTEENVEPLFLGFAYFLCEVLNRASKGFYFYSETFFSLKKNDLKNLKKIKKEFETLGYMFNVTVERTAKRLTITISWN